MSTSILQDTKKVLGMEPDYTAFDTDIVIHINSALMILQQLGIRPDDGYEITGPDETWEDYLGTDSNISAIKSYIVLEVQNVFDPPQSSFVSEARSRTKDELSWRVQLQADYLANMEG